MPALSGRSLMEMPDKAGIGILSQMGALYLRARWYLGVGLVLVPLAISLSGAALGTTWVLAASGAFILAHAFAQLQWRMDNVTSTLFIDLTAVHVAVWVVTRNGADHSAVLLTMVGAAVLVTLFTSGWVRIVALAFNAGLGIVTLLDSATWSLGEVFGDIVGVLFVVVVVVGVISTFRERLIELEVARVLTIGVVTHELRNRLTGVIGVTELLTDPSGAAYQESEVRELLIMANDEAREAEQVIEDLLIASRTERGILETRPEPGDVAELTEKVVRGMSSRSRDIVVKGTADPVWAMVDPFRYSQILRNLLINAVRYGGPEVRVSVERQGEVISVMVADNGQGIHSSDVPALFHSYRKLKHRQPTTGSTGLGLWIARNLSRGMGGDLVYRRQGDLTVFEVLLVAANATPRPSSRTEVDEPRDAPKTS